MVKNGIILVSVVHFSLGREAVLLVASLYHHHWWKGTLSSLSSLSEKVTQAFLKQEQKERKTNF